MDKPIIASKKPIVVNLKKDEQKVWCTCGATKNQPYCDGSHRNTSFKPLPFKAKKDGENYICMCRRTNEPPYCDGTHTKLKDEDKNKHQDQNFTKSLSSLPYEEPSLNYIKTLAEDGLKTIGHHGIMEAMGVPIPELPQWKDIQILVSQLADKPLQEEVNVGTELIIGSKANKPLKLEIPLFVSDMSFGSLSEEAKIALAKGAEMAGTGICSGEGGMLDEEQYENSRYFYEYASAGYGFDWEKLKKVQAFHFKGGQAAKTGIGGHLSGNKVTAKIAEVRHLKEGTSAISPSAFKDLTTPDDFRGFANKVRAISGGIPIGFKLSANHIEDDIKFALQSSADYIILDGRGGGTGAAPLLFRDNISVPTIPALARARKYLDKLNAKEVTLIITGGLRVPEDFVKAMALGADGVAIANSALQSIGCVAARICNTNNCPAGIATQDPELRRKINVEKSSKQLFNFLTASVSLMKILARACSHRHLNQFNLKDITTWKKNISDLSGIQYGGISKY